VHVYVAVLSGMPNIGAAAVIDSDPVSFMSVCCLVLCGHHVSSSSCMPSLVLWVLECLFYMFVVSVSHWVSSVCFLSSFIQIYQQRGT
jgi:hypothetical protein